MTATIMSNLLQKLSIHFAHFYNSAAGVDSEQLKNIGSFKSEVSHKETSYKYQLNLCLVKCPGELNTKMKNRGTYENE